ncbi:hypothetical protein IWX49DRAFT_340996 [Phyllosticta citricarpa]
MVHRARGACETSDSKFMPPPFVFRTSLLLLFSLSSLLLPLSLCLPRPVPQWKRTRCTTLLFDNIFFVILRLENQALDGLFSLQRAAWLPQCLSLGFSPPFSYACCAVPRQAALLDRWLLLPVSRWREKTSVEIDHPSRAHGLSV